MHPATEILGGIKVKPDQFFIVGVTILAAVLLYWLLYRTRFGKAMRATADNPGLAEASGIDTGRIRYGTWIVGGMLAALAGVMLGLQAEVRFDAGFRLLLPLFAAVILGGIGNPWGALFGGLLVGIAQEVSTQWINTGLTPGLPFVIVIVVLVLRPRGLFGQAR
ncbi:MAG: branched-chain amino acid ABC transporter permease [Chloroflexi bacterium]|nr:branched-chain amino acid ABC transporter permease [Chloroflexota bacterium]